MKVIGLTGRIGCGKSTVAALLRARGVAAVDADQVARAVRDEDRAVQREIVARFGTLDPAQLAGLVFGHPQALADLEAIIHPRVRELVARWLADQQAAGTELAVVEAIKLLESPLRGQCDTVWLVVCRADDARQRLASRGLSEAEIDARMASQATEGELRAEADVVIDGSAELAETGRQVEAALAALRA